MVLMYILYMVYLMEYHLGAIFAGNGQSGWCVMFRMACVVNASASVVSVCCGLLMSVAVVMIKKLRASAMSKPMSGCVLCAVVRLM